MAVFLIVFFIIFSIVGGLSLVWPPLLWSLVLFLPFFVMGLADILQTRHTIRRNFPVIGNLRYFFESIRPELCRIQSQWPSDST